MAAGPDYSNYASLIAKEKDSAALLQYFDFAFLIDDSASISGSPWAEAVTAVHSLVEVCLPYDPTGVDLYFVNKQSPEDQGTGWVDLKSSEVISGILSEAKPAGQDLLGARLNEILDTYVSCFEEEGTKTTKPLRLIVITAGQISNDPAPVLKELANRLEEVGAPKYQLGINFLQVGHDDGATARLKTWEDHLSAERDIVEATTFEATGGDEGGVRVLSPQEVFKVLLGAVLEKDDK